MTNKIIHEWLGKCWHESKAMEEFNRNNDCPTSALTCDKCSARTDIFHAADFPDYEHDLNAVREAELKAIEEFGAETYAVAVCRTIRYTIPHAYVELIPFITAPASARASAIVRLLEGR